MAPIRFVAKDGHPNMLASTTGQVTLFCGFELRSDFILDPAS